MKTHSTKPILSFVAAAALAALALTSCGEGSYPKVESAVCSEANGLSNEVVMEALQVIVHYAETGDACYATPQHRITMLHLAALSFDKELVRELLAKGADVNARMLPTEADGKPMTPLFFMLRASCGNCPEAESLLAVADELRRAGAELSPAGGEPLLKACMQSYNVIDLGNADQPGDRVTSRFIEWGAPTDAAEMKEFLFRNWYLSAAALLPRLTEAERGALRQDDDVWSDCAAPFDHSQYVIIRSPGHEAGPLAFTAALLDGLDLGAQPEHPARQAFRRVAAGLAQEAVVKQEDKLAGHADFLALLLAHGADAYAPLGAFGKACAADIIAAHPTITARFVELGAVPPPPPAHELTEGELVEQLTDIPVAAFRTEEAQRHFDLLARLITEPTPAWLEEPLLQRQACARALALMLRADREATQQFLMEQPAWRDPAAWEGEATAARGMLYALQKLGSDEHALPASFVAGAAQAMNAAGHPMPAHAFAALLQHDAGDEAGRFIEDFAQREDAPALRAAALTCRLHRLGLPAMDDLFEHLSGESKWDYEHPVELARLACESARCLSRIAPLEQPERLFYTGSGTCCANEPGPNDRTRAALLELGAPLAADWYMTAQGDPAAASLELETALSLHILRHEKEFRHPRQIVELNHIERLLNGN